MANVYNISDSNVNAGGNNNDIQSNRKETEQENKKQVQLIARQVKQIDELIILIKILINKII